jgi:YfiH family protein
VIESAMHNDPWMTPDWDVPSNVRAVVTTRGMPGASQPPFGAFNLGARCGDAAAAVAANRAAVVSMLGLPSAPSWLRQVHGVDVFDADATAVSDGEPEADAAVARADGAVLAVLTADCLPILFCAEDGSAIGVAHAGWRGLAGGVIEATIAALGVPGARLLAWLGPAIAAPSYEVGDEVRAAFVAADARAAEAFAPTRPGHWHCDLYALARQRLAAAGVARIQGGDFDTFTDTRFYSYRRERETGRFASMIWSEAGPKRAVSGAAAAIANTADAPPSTLFARLLGDAFATLPARVRELHRAPGKRSYHGAATVKRGNGWLSRLCGWAAGLPAAAPESQLGVEIAADAHGETWTRNFGAQAMRSRLWQAGSLLRERVGLVTFGFALSASDGVLRWDVHEVRALGLRWPARWFSGVHACESEQDGRYRFEVRAALPLVGDLVHYEGWLALPHE